MKFQKKIQVRLVRLRRWQSVLAPQIADFDEKHGFLPLVILALSVVDHINTFFYPSRETVVTSTAIKSVVCSREQTLSDIFFFLKNASFRYNTSRSNMLKILLNLTR